jgi:hypothetical protein
VHLSGLCRRKGGAVIAPVAQRLGVSERALRAVLRVECGSDQPARWVNPDGSAIVRVEARHVLRRSPTPTTWALRVVRPDGSLYRGGPGCPPVVGGVIPEDQVEIDGAWRGYHDRQRRAADGTPGEYDALDVATQAIGGVAAAECSSWGPGQVLGTHARAMGYASAGVLAVTAASPEGGLELVARYLERVSPWALAALRVLDWRAFAERYNGAGNVKQYSEWLQREYEELA